MHYVSLPNDYLSDMTGYMISIYIWEGSPFPYKNVRFLATPTSHNTSTKYLMESNTMVTIYAAPTHFRYNHQKKTRNINRLKSLDNMCLRTHSQYLRGLVDTFPD